MVKEEFVHSGFRINHTKMTELTKKQIKDILWFLDTYKSYVGMADWTIQLSTTIVDMEEIANIDPNVYEKEAKIVLGDKFLGKSSAKQYNILFHELMHCRVCIYKEHLDEYITIMEEHFVNDITRGFEKALKEEWQ